jgi:hypothetical protein
VVDPVTLRALEDAVRASWGPDVCEVRLRDGSQRGFHWWNRLARIDIDLTLEQFGADERVQEPRVLSRLAGPLRRGEAEYLLLRSRVLARLAGN